MKAAEFRLIEAMLKAGLTKRPPKRSPLEHARRTAIERELQRRRYCNAFALWRTCGRKACRRARACGGDPHLCLRKVIARLPSGLQGAARQAILAATPHNIGAPEREARQCMPHDLCE